MNIPGALRARVHWSYPGELKNTRTTQVHRQTDTQRQRHAHTIAHRHIHSHASNTQTLYSSSTGANLALWALGHRLY